MSIKMIVGLGNPGKEYELTRHNVGFWWVDALLQQNSARLKEERKFFGEVAKIPFAGRDVWILKPNTFMNQSGMAVASLAQFYKVMPEEILVVHDELDIESGRIKLKLGGGNGGHNGLKDIQLRLGTAAFYRLRFGIGHPGAKHLVTGYVLGKPDNLARQQIDAAIDKSLQGLPLIMTGDIEAAMRLLHSQ